ncbi:MAG: DUF4142 domain-containing protein [Planctomycetes bacterium]|nr:DUF4142 domain-containing protein [Planctomycetota bacterium]
MLRRHGLAFCAAAALLLAAGAVGAQEQERERNQNDQERPRAAAQERDPAAAGAQRTETDRPGEARGQRERNREGQAGRGQQLEQQLATMLALGNWKEIQVSQLAAQKAQSPEVKEFAQKMVQDHTQFLQQLQQFVPQGQLDDLRSSGGREAVGAVDARTGVQPEGAADREREARPGAERNREGADRKREANREEQAADQPNRQRRPGAAGQASARGPGGPITQIAKQATKRSLQRTTELLNEKQGREFDQCYIGQQIVAHIETVSKLEAMQNHGSPQFQAVIRKGVQTTEEHLKEAGAIAQTLERAGGARPTGAQPARTP